MAGELMSIKEVAEYLDIHEMTVYKLACVGKIPCFKVGGQWRFQKNILEQWITDGMHKNKNEVESNKAEKNITKILVIDNNPDDKDLTIRTLKEAEFECEIASAAQGFDAWNQVVEFKPDIVILNLELPDIDSSRICEGIRMSKDMKGIKILIITASDTSEIRERILSLGADDYMVKDFGGSKLIVRVKRLLEI